MPLFFSVPADAGLRYEFFPPTTSLGVPWEFSTVLVQGDPRLSVIGSHEQRRGAHG